MNNYTRSQAVALHLKKQRIQAGSTQAVYALLFNIDERTYRRWEKDGIGNVDLIEYVAGVLGIPFEELCSLAA